MKAQEEIESLHKINVNLEAKIKMHATTTKQLKETLRSKEREFKEAQAQLASTKEELNGTLVSLQALIKITN